jgi:hypothetical protein
MSLYELSPEMELFVRVRTACILSTGPQIRKPAARDNVKMQTHVTAPFICVRCKGLMAVNVTILSSWI